LEPVKELTVRQEPLSKIERLVLMNQYAILEKVDRKNAKEYAKNQRILDRGYAFFYSEMMPSDEVPYERCQLVVDILDMFRALKRSYNELTDKSGIDPKEVRFDGFDGNNESDLLSFAEFLQKDRRYQESLKGDLNSHAMRQDWYKRMLARFNTISESHAAPNKWDLTKDEIKEIVAVR
jgi:hypothetical protein